MSKDSLINAYRPTKLSQVIGQDEVVDSFERSLEDKVSHAFCFSGPPGCGKTTLSRIGAELVGSKRGNIVDIDAATHSGIDDMRSITEALAYRPLGKGSTKSIIVDEAHALSANAWKGLLKSVEEPPYWVYWFFCTTEVNKVPAAIQSRCSNYTLKPVAVSVLFDYLLDIVKREGFKTDRQIVDLCAKRAEGSPRRALSNLAVCYAARDRKEASSLIEDQNIELGGAAFKLAQSLAKGDKWETIQPLISALSESEENPESVRHTIRSYFTKVVIGSKNEQTACNALRVLDNFSETFNAADGMTPLVIAIGRSIF